MKTMLKINVGPVLAELHGGEREPGGEERGLQSCRQERGKVRGSREERGKGLQSCTKERGSKEERGKGICEKVVQPNNKKPKEKYQKQKKTLFQHLLVNFPFGYDIDFFKIKQISNPQPQPPTPPHSPPTVFANHCQGLLSPITPCLDS